MEKNKKGSWGGGERTIREKESLRRTAMAVTKTRRKK